jgi:hypothetical protein
MRTRIRGLVAVVIASAAIGGALAAPASAAAPLATYTFSCFVGVSHVSGSGSGTLGEVHRAIAPLHQTCDRGTLVYTITKL